MLDELMAAYGNRFIVAAVGVCLALVVLVIVLWLMRNRASSPFVRGGRNRQPRLQVLDAAAVDARRRLVLIRRDNIEHLIMIGGPTDIVIESGIGEPKAYLAGELSSPLAVTAPPPPDMLDQRMPPPMPEARPQPAEQVPAARLPVAPAPVQPPAQKPAGEGVRAAERPMPSAQAAPSRPATPPAEPPRPVAPRPAVASAPATTAVPIQTASAAAPAQPLAAPKVHTAPAPSVAVQAPAPQPVAEEPVFDEPPAKVVIEPPARPVSAATAPAQPDAPPASSRPAPEPFPASRFNSLAERAEPPMERRETGAVNIDMPIGYAANILDAARDRVLQPQAEPFPASRFTQQPARLEPEVAPTVTPAAVRTPEFSEFERVLEEEMASHMAADPRLAKSLAGLGPVPVNAPADSKPAPITGAGEEQNIQKEIARIFGEMSASRNS